MTQHAEENLFGPYRLADLDLVARLRNGWPLAKAAHDQWYGEGPGGYTDFPTYSGAEDRKGGQ